MGEGVRVMVFKATFNNILSYIVAVSFIGGGNWRKPPTCCKLLTNFTYGIQRKGRYSCIRKKIVQTGDKILL
jgi:hypothetical protein